MIRYDSKLANRIMHLVARYYKITDAELKSSTRAPKYSEPRHVAMYCLNKFAGTGYAPTAKIFDMSHCTALYAIKKVQDWINMPILNGEAVKCVTYVKTTIDNDKTTKE